VRIPWCCATLAITCGILVAADAEGRKERGRPVVGAIRWDAWHGEASNVGLVVEKTLSPQRWHYRLPFYGVEVSPTQVQVRANTQAIMDREIAYARAAGLDYWAFVTYAPDAAMSLGLKLYLSSTRKGDINFCLNLQGGCVGAGGAKNWPAQVARYVGCFKEPAYQKVAGGRPLVYLFQAGDMVGQGKFASWSDARAAFDELRKATVAAGLPTPYIVAQHWSPPTARDHADKLGLDAVGAYASNGGGKRAPYAQLAAHTEKWWDAFRETRAKVVPLATTGWDRRPRVENNVPWEPAGGDPDAYYESPAPRELAAHLKAALDWNAAHPKAAEAKAILIYAWNETDEGGWLVPTHAEGAKRLDAIGDVLKKR